MTKSETLDTAKKIVTGNREQEYGKAENNFGVIGQLWTDYLGHIVTAEDVANMMILFKVARNRTGNGKADNWVDIAGYAACGCEIATETPPVNCTVTPEMPDHIEDVEEAMIKINNDVLIILYKNGYSEISYRGGLKAPDRSIRFTGTSLDDLRKNIVNYRENADNITDIMIADILEGQLKEYIQERGRT